MKLKWIYRCFASYFGCLFILLMGGENASGAIGVQAERIKITPSTDTIDFTVHYWDEDDNTPSPCNPKTLCLVAVGWQYEGQVGTLVETLNIYPSNNVKTVGEIGKLYRARFGIPHSGVKSGPTIGNRPGQKICFAMKYRSSGTPSYNVPALMPGDSCTYIDPIDPVACYVHAPSTININHWVVNASDLNNSIASENVRVTCNKRANIRIRVTDTEIRMKKPNGADGNVSSKIYLNGDYFMTPLVVNDIGSVLNVESRLSSSGDVSGGVLSGSTVMIVDIF
ncbi:MrpH family fimbial adhesin [Serratia marcescens]|uniref:MrpH family fimbial adhesin n=1 Tax=Serratia marcescens TaxID=615 RepID=UPI00148CC6CB|nr:hypothetical protein [Serratia marcescens]QJU38090.1 hypothetical protein HMI62_01540 [Serratia marcescens]